MPACLERRSLFGGFNFENYRDYDRRGQFLKGLVALLEVTGGSLAGSMNDRICVQGLRVARGRLEGALLSRMLLNAWSVLFCYELVIGSYGGCIWNFISFG